MDPLAEKYYSISPYAYCGNNPVNRIDPTGMDPVDENQRKPVWQQFAEGIKNLFSINIDTSSPATIDASKQQLDKNQEIVQQATELINTVAEMISAVNPVGSTVTTGVKIANGQEVTSGDITFSALEVVPAVTTIKTGAKVAKIVKTVDKIEDTATGVIKGFSKHGLDRAIERGVKPAAILDAVKSPLKKGEVITDGLGRQSQRYVGKSAEVVINPQTNKVISVNPTSTKKATKLLKP